MRQHAPLGQGVPELVDQVELGELGAGHPAHLVGVVPGGARRPQKARVMAVIDTSGSVSAEALKHIADGGSIVFISSIAALRTGSRAVAKKSV